MPAGMSTSPTDPSIYQPRAGGEWLKLQSLPKTALICGSAPVLQTDFGMASSKIERAAVIVVNEAGRVVRGDHLVTQHPEKALWFRECSLNPDITIHTGKPRQRASQAGINVYWPDCVTLATSGGSAIAIALRMGFEEIILCGMPMNGGDGYFKQSVIEQDEPRFGLEPSASDYVRNYQEKLVEFAKKEPEALNRVRSLSGFTRELFGAPDWHSSNWKQ